MEHCSPNRQRCPIGIEGWIWSDGDHTRGADTDGGILRNPLFDGNHDPLWAKATVLDDGKERVVLITVDLISTTAGWLMKHVN